MSLSKNTVLIDLKKKLSAQEKRDYQCKGASIMDDADQKFHDAIERSCAEMYERYGKK